MCGSRLSDALEFDYFSFLFRGEVLGGPCPSPTWGWCCVICFSFTLSSICCDNIRCVPRVNRDIPYASRFWLLSVDSLLSSTSIAPPLLIVRHVSVKSLITLVTTIRGIFDGVGLTGGSLFVSWRALRESHVILLFLKCSDPHLRRRLSRCGCCLGRPVSASC